MKLRRRAVVVLLGAMVLCGGVVTVLAQDAPPDLRMLMDLDLFESRHNNAKGAPTAATSPADDSMLDQIRALDAMGYLGDRGARAAAPRATAVPPQSSDAQSSPAANAQTEPAAPASQPSYDAEGPEP